MSISILNRGASGGLKPELTVTAPSGSTIDLLRNGIIVATYTLGASETEHTFIVKVGTYMVRGMLGEKSNTAEVVIDTVGRYSIKIKYGFYLIENGQLNEDITFSTDIAWTGYGTVTYNSDNVHLNLKPRSDSQGNSVSIFTGILDLSEFSKAHIRCSYDSCYGYSHRYNDGFGFNVDDGNTWASTAEQMDYYVLIKDSATDVTLTVDVSKITNAVCRVVLNNQSKGSGSTPNQVWIYDIWLE